MYAGTTDTYLSMHLSKKKKNLSMHIYIQEKLKLVLKTQRQHPFS